MSVSLCVRAFYRELYQPLHIFPQACLCGVKSSLLCPTAVSRYPVPFQVIAHERLANAAALHGARPLARGHLERTRRVEGKKQGPLCLARFENRLA
jgi:hypothetical protein